MGSVTQIIARKRETGEVRDHATSSTVSIEHRHVIFILDSQYRCCLFIFFFYCSFRFHTSSSRLHRWLFYLSSLFGPVFIFFLLYSFDIVCVTRSSFIWSTEKKNLRTFSKNDDYFIFLYFFFIQNSNSFTIFYAFWHGIIFHFTQWKMLLMIIQMIFIKNP